MKKQRHFLRRLMLLILVLVVGAAAYLYWLGFFDPLVPARADDALPMAEDKLSILLIGSDGNEEFANHGERADTIIFVSIDLQKQEVFLLSIPRDTRVNIPGHGEEKINHAYAYGGSDLLRETVESLLGVPVDYYLATDFSSFVEIVDMLGGVDIEVDKRMYYQTYDGLIDIQAGLQHLDGETALQYVRFRQDELGDITRVGRQQKFLKALAEKILADGNWWRLPGVLSKLFDLLQGDLSQGQLLRLAWQLRKLDFEQISSATLPGNFATIAGVSYWQMDAEEAQALLETYFL